MNIENLPFSTIAWDSIPVVELPGATYCALVRSVTVGEIRMRMIEFAAGYKAEGWPSKGHIVLVLSGSLTTKLKDGRTFQSPSGTSFHVADNDGQHLVESETGATVFIVD